MTRVGHAMRPAWRFLRCSTAEQWLLIRTFLLLLVIAIVIRTVPLVSLQRVLSRVARGNTWAVGREEAPATLVWAVAAASRYVPRSTCLARALAVMTLLELHGWPSLLRIGLGHRGDGALAGHAWVEGPDGRVISEETPFPYTPLPLFDEVKTNGA